MHLDGVAGHGDAEAGSPELDQRRAVGHLHHAGEAPAITGAGFTARLTRKQECLGIDELNFGRRDRARAELVLETTDANAVARAVTPFAQHEERRDAARAVGRAL